jgi:hypothetical protein
MSRPLGSPPTSRQQGLLSYYGPVRRRASHRYSVPSVSASARSLSSTGGPQDPMNGRRYRHPPSHVPCKTCRPGSRRLCAGHRLANKRAPARLIPGKGQGSPVSMSSLNSRRFDSDALAGFPAQALLARLRGPHLMRSCRTFSLSLTTTVFSQRSTGWFDACPRRPTSEGHTSISCTASLPKDLLHDSSFCVRDAQPPFANRDGRTHGFFPIVA